MEQYIRIYVISSILLATVTSLSTVVSSLEVILAITVAKKLIIKLGTSKKSQTC